MRVEVDGEQVVEIQPWEMKLLEFLIPKADLDADLKRRVQYILTHKVERAFYEFEQEWLKNLRADPSVSSIPTDKEQFIQMVTARPDYKDRDARDAELRQ